MKKACLSDSLCGLGGAYPTMRCSGASAVLKVAVRSLPCSGLRSVRVGVYFGEVMSVMPVKVGLSLPLSSLWASALWYMEYPSIMKVVGELMWVSVSAMMWMLCCFMCLMMVWILAASVSPVVFQHPSLVRCLLGILVDCLYLLWCGVCKQWVLNQCALVACMECVCCVVGGRV